MPLKVVNTLWGRGGKFASKGRGLAARLSRAHIQDSCEARCRGVGRMPLLGGGLYLGAPSASTASIGDSNAMNRTQGPALAQRASCLALAGPYAYDPGPRTEGFCPS